MTKNAETLGRVRSVSDDASEKAVALQDTLTHCDTTVMAADLSDALATSTAPSSLKKSTPRVARVGADGSMSAFLIQTAESDENKDALDESHWEAAYRGVPSWLSSLLIHLSLLLLLAVLSVSSGGKQIVSLLADTAESVEVEPYTLVEVALQPEEIETVSEEVQADESLMAQASELAPVLDEALLSADVAAELEQSLFDQVSSKGLSDAELQKSKKSAAEFFGIEGEGNDFVFIIDCSDSMNEYGRWNQALAELKRSIKDLNPDQRFLILLYNSGYIAMNNRLKLVACTQRQRDRAVRWLSSKTPSDWTYCAEALADALKLRPSAIFLLSDGEFSDRNEVFGVLDRYNNRRKAKTSEMPQVPVHTVALGSHMGRFTMQRIAQENNGKFKLIE